jgi:hypothetical protein
MDSEFEEFDMNIKDESTVKSPLKVGRKSQSAGIGN